MIFVGGHPDRARIDNADGLGDRIISGSGWGWGVREADSPSQASPMPKTVIVNGRNGTADPSAATRMITTGSRAKTPLRSITME